ncbi:hypothetical protein [Curtobacterium aurantiacum]|uniref:hypothetical protein n=1 Tax=Curtobacterium aurantiacum TaxID=3236919 RepID=UPI001BE09A4F|nr:hypothetical protein [Curtobacterium flaccumfaciens]MBT1676793.1 hypothetical protein [Curtobacterium flaccumfaciens pv. flaccumfaciens]
MTDDDQAGSMVPSVTGVDIERSNALAKAMTEGNRTQFDAVLDSAMDDADRSPYESMKGLVEALTAAGLHHFFENLELRAEQANETLAAQIAAFNENWKRN